MFKFIQSDQIVVWMYKKLIVWVACCFWVIMENDARGDRVWFAFHRLFSTVIFFHSAFFIHQIFGWSCMIMESCVRRDTGFDSSAWDLARLPNVDSVQLCIQEWLLQLAKRPAGTFRSQLKVLQFWRHWKLLFIPGPWLHSGLSPLPKVVSPWFQQVLKGKCKKISKLFLLANIVVLKILDESCDRKFPPGGEFWSEARLPHVESTWNNIHMWQSSFWPEFPRREFYVVEAFFLSWSKKHTPRITPAEIFPGESLCETVVCLHRFL